MICQPRTNDTWWIDQYGKRWSAFWLWRAEQRGDLRPVLVDETVGVRIEATKDDDPLQLVEIPANDPNLDVRSRAVLSGAERELLRSEGTASGRRDEVISRLRWRVLNELPDDIFVLREHEPGLYEAIRLTVLDPRAAGEQRL